jgi:glycosyltransferase involved in cell wall biosynthesis
MQFVADCSLSLINRTGAHFIARTIVEGLPSRFAAVRHWRLTSGAPSNEILRKVAGRLMLKELEWLRGAPILRWPDCGTGPSTPVLYMDPLYVLRGGLKSDDIVICHDVGPLSTPQFFDRGVTSLYEEAYARIRAVGPGIVFVSRASMSEYRRVVGGDARFQAAVPLFVRDGAADVIPAPVEGLEAPFFLCVGASEKRKNIPLAIRAFAASGLARQGHRFVVCGARGNDWRAVADEIGRTENTVHLDYVTDSQLVWLYREATAFVLPSLLEGFGMPALEAVRHGCLPIVPADGALAEATGGRGLFVDPQSAEDIAAAMRTAALTHGTRPAGTAAGPPFVARSRADYLDEMDVILASNAAVQAAAGSGLRRAASGA